MATEEEIQRIDAWVDAHVRHKSGKDQTLAEIMELVEAYAGAMFELGQNAGDQNVMCDYDERSDDANKAFDKLEQCLRDIITT